MPGSSPAQVSAWRRRVKANLVAAHGGICVDCGFAGPPYMYDFDHRNPQEKLFAVSDGSSRSYARQLLPARLG